MKNRTICTTAEVDIDVAEILYELDYGDIYDWIGDLEPKDRAEFLLGLPECFEDIICDDPPNAKCTEDGDLVFYTEEAISIYDKCHYSHKVIFCDNGCDNSNGNYECITPCDGVVCDDPPDGFCGTDKVVPENSATINFRYSYCKVNKDSSTQCIYIDDMINTCNPNYHCEVINGIAECVED